MYVIAQLCKSLAYLFDGVFRIVYWLLILRIVLTWFGVHPQTTYNELLNVLYRITDPILAPFRRLPLVFAGIDFSPIVAFLFVEFLRQFIVGVLMNTAARLG